MKLHGSAVLAITILLTLASAAWQRRTGPSYPVRGSVRMAGEEIRMRLPRSHGGPGDMIVRIPAGSGIEGELAWRRHPTADPWTRIAMERDEDATGASGDLVAAIPHQPPSGKVEYQVFLRESPTGTASVFPERPAVARFRGRVPVTVLAPHVVAMFLGMLFSNLAGIQSLTRVGRPRRSAILALALIAIGGLALGPVVQKLAFGAWWTGVPFGTDLTDNKTLIAALAWLAAVLATGSPRRGARAERLWFVSAALVTLAVFVIPHSAWGSELRWDQPGGSPPGASTGTPG